MIRYRGITIDAKRQCVEHRGTTIYFSPQRFKLMHALLLAGPKTRNELTEIIFKDADDGGPLSWVRSVDVMLCQLKGMFASLGLELRKTGPHTFRRYCLLPGAQSNDHPVRNASPQVETRP